MTNKETIDILNNTAWLGTDTGIKIYPAVKMAVDALEKQDKYRWHDLRKNQEDLPERDGYYITCFLFNDGYQYGIREFVERDMLFSCGAMTIAWREIEPFEEE